MKQKHYLRKAIALPLHVLIVCIYGAMLAIGWLTLKIEGDDL